MKIAIAVAQEKTNRRDVQDAVRCAAFVEKILLKKAFKVETLPVCRADFKHPEELKARVARLAPDCVFNLFEGFSDNAGYEAMFAKLVEETGIPFTGNYSSTLDCCLNKQKVKGILRRESIAVPSGMLVLDAGSVDPETMIFPVFVKPCFEDASVGIDADSLIIDKNSLHEVLASKLEQFPRGVVVEEFIPGNEYNAGFTGNAPYELLGISITDFSLHKTTPPFFTYCSKWNPDCPEYNILVPSPEGITGGKLRNEITETARRAAKVLECTGYFRVDLREKDGRLYVLDVNPNPDINADSGFMRQACHSGYTCDQIIEIIINTALQNKISNAGN